jgi:hypothetical protein
MNGVFTISLDFELHWGGFEKWPLEKYKAYFLNTREIIPQILIQFEQHKIHCTWATVGMLLHDSRISLEKFSPDAKPSYSLPELSAYCYIKNHGIGDTESDDPFHYASSLVKKIINTPWQELGSHTFAHYYCNEPDQTIAEFRSDLQASQNSAKLLFGKKLKSLVFPRNQFNEEYLKACYEEGFIAVRDNPRDWFWNIRRTHNESLWKRLNRGLDAYVPIGRKNTYNLQSLECSPGLPISIPASRLLRPYRRQELFLNDMKIARIKLEMQRAARQGEVYHLWWHPHNFGYYPKESMDGLIEVLNHFSMCKEKYGMSSLSMGEVAEKVLENNTK